MQEINNKNKQTKTCFTNDGQMFVILRFRYMYMIIKIRIYQNNQKKYSRRIYNT